MAMSATILAADLASALGITDTVAVAKLYDFASTLIAHIQANAQVVTADTGTAGPYPVVATGSGNIT